MKLKSSLLSKDLILMMEYRNDYINLYYADGHNEMLLDQVQNYIVKKNKGYKNPVLIQEQWLYPTTNYRREDCLWIHLDCLEEYCHAFIPLLKTKQLCKTVRNMYLKHINMKLIEKGLE